MAHKKTVRTNSGKIQMVRVPEEPSKESAFNALNGVSVEWLRRAFHTTGTKVVIKLKGLTPIAFTERGKPLYDIQAAAARLVKPKMDLEEYLKDITPDMLPDKLKEAYWNAKLKEQRYLKNGGELWRTEAVIQLFGSVLKDTKERAKMIVTVSERAMSLSPEQVETLRGIVNQFQDDVYRHINDLEEKTPSSVAELNKEFGAEEDDADYNSPSALGVTDDFEY